MLTIRRLTEADDRSTLSCGEPDLDRFFQQHAGQHQFKRRASVTYVALDSDRIIGFVTVCPGTLTRGDLGPLFRNFPPFPLPVLLVARLGVNTADQARGTGSSLLRHALSLAREMGSSVGCVGVAVDSKPDAVAWYERYGFSPITAPAHASYQRLLLPITAIPGTPT